MGDLVFLMVAGTYFKANSVIAFFDQLDFLRSRRHFQNKGTYIFSKYRGVIFLGQVPIFNIEATFLIIRSHFSFDRRWLLS